MSKVIGARRSVRGVGNKEYPPLCLLPFEDDKIVKHFLYHVLPLGGEHQWSLDRNIDKVCGNLDQFNGKKLVAIAIPSNSDKKVFLPPEYVKDRFKINGYTDIEYIEVINRKQLREVSSFSQLLSSVYSLNPNEVVFYGHCKGITHADPNSICHIWANMMYDTVYNNWEQAKIALQYYGIAGSFKKYGTFKTLYNHRWHYSGTFYWFRSASVFVRKWDYIDKVFYGTESWPGGLFRPDEGACLFHDNTGDLYREKYEDLLSRYQIWKSQPVQALALTRK